MKKFEEALVKYNLKKIYLIPIGVVFLFWLIYLFLLKAPGDFPKKSIITIENGSGLLELSHKLKVEHVIKSENVFRTFAILLGGERGMQAGDYYFESGQNVYRVASRIVRGEHDIATVRITIPEGFTNAEISALFDPRFQKFDHAYFLNNAPQGYLFPDTYFIEVGATASSTIILLKNNFERKVAPLEAEIKSSGHSLKEIILMASILESEAKTELDREIVSGILWKRIKLGMALQVDSSPETYSHRGFPNTPISNPGIESIKAAIHPKSSTFLYFLTGSDGLMHYAKTLNDHNKNINKYLR